MTPTRSRTPVLAIAGAIVLAFAAFRTAPADRSDRVRPWQLRSWTHEIPVNQGFVLDRNQATPGRNGFVITDVLATSDTLPRSVLVQIESPTTTHATVPVLQSVAAGGAGSPAHVELRHGIPVPAGEPLQVRVLSRQEGATAWVTLLGYAW